MRTLSTNGEKKLKDLEGLRLVAYQCTANKWTLGIGCTTHADGRPVKRGDTLKDEAEAWRMFRLCVKKYIKAVNELVTINLNQNQFDALVSFVFNIGIGSKATNTGFAGSTLLKKINANELDDVPEQMARWIKETDPETGLLRVNQGLLFRRLKEIRLFFT